MLLNSDGKYCYLPTTHKITLGGVVDLLKQFTAQPPTLMIPEIPSGSFAKKRLTRKSLCLSVDFLKPEEEEANVGYAS